ncbi:permease [Piscirickettsia salmonis]|uniref:CBU-0592-like domain-containing protein n=1 Tax=Piscirickettsia salmonis TaxID=1238 RepID=A0A9Q5V864_PISSA|nr:hypothetical protein [Piscirickettsia salmonis]RNC76686.1 hypothetical protein DA717_14555 [Piscirickettsiaceae bacterium NZ-RLO2]WGZ72995.1 hypothetical protein E3220_04340 [Piscirickettsia salmonis EM-90]ALA25092.1 membrane protein [Piscirickettsia salmonis]APS45370.1 permease [Piscirickettsia salmonis]APS48730.1 permease [Piscirickettsia salmonis]
MSLFGQLIGTVGMALVVIAYFLVVSQRVTPGSLPFSVINLIGAILLLISLCIHFNLGSFIIEIFWILISLYGIVKWCLQKALRNQRKKVE